MAELTHDAVDDGFHEIQLSGKQLAFLVIMSLSGLVLTFLLGVQVGRGVRAERGEDPPLDPAPVTSTAAAESGAAAPVDPPAPTPDAPLSYPERLGTNPPAQERLSATPKEAEPPAPSARTPEPSPEPPPPAAETKAAPPPAAAAPAAAKVPSSGRKGRWVVQVISLRNRAGAEDIAQRLISKGYPAFMLPPTGAPALYRVQVGAYNDRNEADRIARRLTREEGFKPEVKR